ncbi:MAG: tryptophan 2,3-dioxygenase [Alphaproteobacteria bacterium]|nr:tryptophan 2,3-dioxygenase [Alphaproteobacteria bacterium]
MTSSDDYHDGKAAADGAVTDFSQRMSYGDYLKLDQVLGAQVRLTERHDEMLFIVIHQASELWMKLALHEIHGAMHQIRDDDLGPAFKMLARVSRIQEQLVQSWSVLTTLTPADYLTFRDALGHASGFQSYQYRMLEFVLGNKDRRMVDPFRHRADILAGVEAVLNAPSLYDESIRLLGRRGFAVAAAQTERDWSAPRPADDSVRAAWLAVYRDTERYWDLYELAEKLVDLEDAFQTWRFRHVTTVERIIGLKRGTGGTAGVTYLRSALEYRFFPEIWNVRTAL